MLIADIHPFTLDQAGSFRPLPTLIFGCFWPAWTLRCSELFRSPLHLPSPLTAMSTVQHFLPLSEETLSSLDDATAAAYGMSSWNDETGQMRTGKIRTNFFFRLLRPRLDRMKLNLSHPLVISRYRTCFLTTKTTYLYSLWIQLVVTTGTTHSGTQGLGTFTVSTEYPLRRLLLPLLIPSLIL